MTGGATPAQSASAAAPSQFPRGTALPSQSPLYWVGQKDRYLRQLLIRDIEELTGRRLVVYFANRFRNESSIDQADPAYVTELLGDVPAGAGVDLMIETNGGETDSTESIVSVLKSRVSDLRVIVANGAKSNGTLICLAANAIVMGPISELGPIDPAIGGIPCTILSQPTVAATNFALNQLAIYALKQTRKLAAVLLEQGMLKGRVPADIQKVVNDLATRDTYFSHGSTIEHREAAAIGLNIQYLPPGDPLWERIWLLYTMYDFDVRRDNYLKVFEGRARSTAVSGATPPK